MYGIVKNNKHYGADHVVWGTDCLWWGSQQWAIDAFKRFQISDEFCEKFGYKKITKEDKANILGLNAAKLYNVDVKAKRTAMPADSLEKLKLTYLDRGGQRSNAASGWGRASDCAARPWQVKLDGRSDTKSNPRTFAQINHGEHGEHGERQYRSASPCSPCSPWLICVSPSRSA